MKVYREKDIDSFALAGREVAIVGYGNQARAQGANIRDSGVRVLIALRQGSENVKLATRDGFRVGTIEEAVGKAHIISMLIPDEYHGEVWEKYLKDRIRSGDMVVFASAVAVHFEDIKFRDDIDVVLVGPMGPGDTLRNEYKAGRGLPAKIAILQDRTGKALSLCLAYAGALGCARVGLLETTFKIEAELDLFSEQVVLCGGIPALAISAFELLVKEGYPPEQAYIETVFEIRAIADLMNKYGVDGMRKRISTTALYGGKIAGEVLVDDKVRGSMLSILDNIRSGNFYHEFKCKKPLKRGEFERVSESMVSSRNEVEKLFMSDKEKMFGKR